MDEYYTFTDLKLIGQSSNSFIFQTKMSYPSQAFKQILPLQQTSLLTNFALKCIFHPPGCCLKECEHLKQEFHILKSINHSNIVNTFEGFFDQKIIKQKHGCMISMELAHPSQMGQQQCIIPIKSINVESFSLQNYEDEQNENEDNTSSSFNEDQNQNVEAETEEFIFPQVAIRDCIDLANFLHNQSGKSIPQNSKKEASHNINQLNIMKCTKEVLKQVLLALKEVHSENFAHNDVKLENIFVFSHEFQTNYYKIKLGDFGLASLQNETKSAFDLISHYKQRSPDKLAPEIFYLINEFSKQQLHQDEDQHLDNNNNKVNLKIDQRKCDMFSLGISMMELLLKNSLFVKKQTLKNSYIAVDQGYYAFVNNQMDAFWILFPKTKQILETVILPQSSQKEIDLFFDLIQNLIAPDPEKRFDTEKALSHKFFINY